jgi:zinc protease
VKSRSSVQSEVTLKQIVNLRRTDADYVPLLLANTILSGEGTGSLLFEELRTRDGYVYNVDSDLDVGRSSATFTISFASDPKDVNRAQAGAVAILERLQRVPLPASELQRAKALLLAQRVLPLDSYSGVASHLLANAEYGLSTADTEAFWRALVGTTSQQIQAAMRRRLRPAHFLRVIVAPGD